MTLIVAATGPESIWLVADRWLSYVGRPPRDDARKVMFLGTTDGIAILGYAGLGATGRGTEPADWMSAVLRGRRFPLKPSLEALAEAMQRQLPRHMAQLPGTGAAAHHVLVPAFVDDEPRLNTIDLILAPDRKSYLFRNARHVINYAPTVAPGAPRIWATGSGALYLKRDKTWLRDLLRLVKANDRGKVSPYAVADYLAKLNNNVHLAVSDKSVGPHSIVAWRFRRGSFHKSGGGHQFYIGSKRDRASTTLPSVDNGMDTGSIAKILASLAMKQVEAMRAGQGFHELDRNEINAALARLPKNPDENLR